MKITLQVLLEPGTPTCHAAPTTCACSNNCTPYMYMNLYAVASPERIARMMHSIGVLTTVSASSGRSSHLSTLVVRTRKLAVRMGQEQLCRGSLLKNDLRTAINQESGHVEWPLLLVHTGLPKHNV